MQLTTPTELQSLPADWSREAREAVLAHWRGDRSVVPMTMIAEVCGEIAAEFRPAKIVLFGSYARGDATLDSDVDLLVIMPFEGSPHEQSIMIRRQINRHGVRFPLDLLVRSPEFVVQRLRMNDWFLREVLAEGRVMYEARDSGMVGQSRG